MMEETAAIVVDKMKNELADKLLGVLWTGSRVYGPVRRNSDWDFFVVTRERWRQRQLFFVHGEEAECFINPVSQIRREFKDHDHPATIGMFAHGRVLWDCDGVTAALVAEAQEIWDAGPLAPDAQWVQFWRYHVCDVWKDAGDLIDEDPSAARLLIGQTVEMALTGHYRLHRHWCPKPKYLLMDLEKWDPVTASWARQALTSDRSMPQLYQSLSQLVARTLDAAGGCLTQWHSIPEIMADE